jgi:hypothetical protein
MNCDSITVDLTNRQLVTPDPDDTNDLLAVIVMKGDKVIPFTCNSRNQCGGKETNLFYSKQRGD